MTTQTVDERVAERLDAYYEIEREAQLAGLLQRYQVVRERAQREIDQLTDEIDRMRDLAESLLDGESRGPILLQERCSRVEERLDGKLNLGLGSLEGVLSTGV